MSALEAAILSSNGNPKPQCQITPDIVPQGLRRSRGRVPTEVHICPMADFQALRLSRYHSPWLLPYMLGEVDRLQLSGHIGRSCH